VVLSALSPQSVFSLSLPDTLLPSDSIEANAEQGRNHEKQYKHNPPYELISSVWNLKNDQIQSEPREPEIGK
jgi:hypothetical protein